MVSKTFELTVPFTQGRDPDTGQKYWLPILMVTITGQDGSDIQVPLLFDTGASFTTFKHSMAPMLFGGAWDSGQPRKRAIPSGSADVYTRQATFELFGKQITCSVDIMKMSDHPLFLGLLGRDQVFDKFGFAIWEGERELYVTLTP